MERNEIEISRLAYDLVVCGGGPAGIAAAVAAATTGCKTLLVERYSRLGGMGTNGLVNQFKVPENPPAVKSLFASVKGHENDSEFLDLAYADLVIAHGVTLLLHATVFDVLTETIKHRKTVRGVRIATPSGPMDVIADRVVDATGDGIVAFLAGAAFDMGRENDGLMQPTTIMFRVSGVAHERSMEANGGRANYKFPEGSWNHVTMAARERGELPWNIGMVRTYMANRESDRYINATQTNYIDATNGFDLTRAELEGRRQIPVVMDFLRRYAPGYEDAHVARVADTVGVRETRRFRGLVCLTREDCLSGRRWPDAVVTGCRAPLDVHNPAGPGQAEGISDKNPAGKDPRPEPYDIPYRCLVPENTDGLLLAGRCISGDHAAHASYRMQNICMATGAAAGFAAAASIRQGVQPRCLEVSIVQAKLGIESTPGNARLQPGRKAKDTFNENQNNYC